MFVVYIRMTTLSTNIKKELLNYYGFDTIKDSYTILGVKKANDAYKALNKEYEKEQQRILKEQAKENAKKFIAEQAKVQKKKEEEKKIRREEKKNEEKKYYKKNLLEFDYTQYSNYHQEFYTLILGLASKDINVVLIQNGKTIKNIQIALPNKNEFANWWKTIGQYLFFYPENIFDEFPNAKLYIYLGKKK